MVTKVKRRGTSGNYHVEIERGIQRNNGGARGKKGTRVGRKSQLKEPRSDNYRITKIAWTNVELDRNI
ncbi:hypothetical protein WN55_04078 [Dufourea novaeangliae]|uniref:Uncharacterized protein n=1 Tax=Dufourea novaeangliae TaxID=178035 RepID=A0A154PKM1_DUFNO|nr:hypothetical protein WN55_04078 [Dufourea novaeangliae]